MSRVCALTLVSALVAIGSAHELCGTKTQKKAVQVKANQLVDQRIAQRAASQRKTAMPPIPIVWHVIHDGANGNVSEVDINAQLKVLQDAYAPAGISWRTGEIIRYNNPDWVDVTTATMDSVIKPATTVTPTRNLNFWTVPVVKSGTDGLLGYAQFPTDFQSQTMTDGVVCATGTLPGGDFASYNLGDTATHEVGHWLMLYHTFQGGCDGGDGVNDTAAEAEPASGCPVDLDTCVDNQGPDPIDNFMDYSIDSCMDKFTAGQNARMVAAIEKWRPSLLGGAECTAGCQANWQGDGYCDVACNTTACGFDSGDCEAFCAPGCPASWAQDGVCQESCNVEACLFDDGKCSTELCNEGCQQGWPGDDYCDPECNTAGCRWDGGDCGPQFYQAALGTQCPLGDSIATKEGCIQALEKLEISKEGITDYNTTMWEGDYQMVPTGCSFREAHGSRALYYQNAHQQGSEHPQSTPVCSINLSPYHLGELGAKCHLVKTIQTAEECKEALEVLGVMAAPMWEGEWDQIQGGCSYRPGGGKFRGHFNSYVSKPSSAVTSGQEIRRPVCRQ